MTGISAREIVTALHGKWRGSYGVVKCVAHADRTPSLRLRDGDTGVPLVHCFAGCDPRDIIAALSRASLWPERDGSAPARKPQPRRIYRTDHPEWVPEARTDDETTRMLRARDLWLTTIPALGTIVETYWRQARGIEIDIPPVIRFGAQIPYWDEERQVSIPLPAMVAKVQAPNGGFAGIHATLIRPDGRGKAEGLDRTRLMFGCVGSGAIRLAPADSHMAIGEGIETTASYMQSSGIAGWAGMSTSGVRSMILPPSPHACRVTLLGENDANGASAAAIQATAPRLRLEGRTVDTAWPAEEYGDFNDPFRTDLRGARNEKIS